MASIAKLRIEGTEYNLADASGRSNDVLTRARIQRSNTLITAERDALAQKLNATEQRLTNAQTRINNIVIPPATFEPINITTIGGTVAINEPGVYNTHFDNVGKNDDTHIFSALYFYLKPTSRVVNSAAGIISWDAMTLRIENVKNVDLFYNNWQRQCNIWDEILEYEFLEITLAYQSRNAANKTITYQLNAGSAQADDEIDPNSKVVAEIFFDFAFWAIPVTGGTYNARYY